MTRLAAGVGRWLALAVLGLASMAAAADARLILSAAESEWVAAHPVIRVGYDPAWPPFSMQDEQGRCVGIDPGLLRLIGERTGLRFEFQTGKTWPEIYEKARAGAVDMLVGTARTTEREKWFRFTAPYFTAPVVIVTRTDEPLLWSELDLVDRKVIGVRGYAPSDELQRLIGQGPIEYVDTVGQALRAVTDREADAFVSNLPNVSFVAKTQGLTNLKVAGVLRGSFDLCYAVRSDWPVLAALLDRASASLTEAEKQAVIHPWIRVDYAKVIRWDLVWKAAAIVLSVLAVVIGAIGFHNRSLARELKERIRLQHEITEAHDQLVQLNEEKTELLQMAAHDLRGPLTGMQLIVDSVLRLNAVPPTAALEMIEKQVRQMTALLNDLLDADALEHGRREFHVRTVDLAALLRTAIVGARAVALNKEIRINDQAIGEALSPVSADPTALRQIADNPLSNAIKFSPRGSVVTVSLEQRDKVLRLEVRDQGPGIGPEETERIFTKYARGSAKPTAGEKSTGLGLAIVRQLATSMNGRVWCEARGPKGGGLFVLVLPTAAAAPPRVV